VIGEIVTVNNTDPRIEAIDPKCSVWISANAGSGKTRVLIDRILRLLIDGVDPQDILCLTYTKAAASEVTDRLLNRISAWVMMNDCEIKESIIDIFPHNRMISIEMCNLLRRLYSQVMTVTGGMKIQTIHSFCENLMRRFPMETGVSPDFKIADSINTLRRQAWMSMINDAIDHKDDILFGALQELSGKLSDYDFEMCMLSIATLPLRFNMDKDTAQDVLIRTLSCQSMANIDILTVSNNDLICGWFTSGRIEDLNRIKDILRISEAKSDKAHYDNIAECLGAYDNHQYTQAIHAVRKFLLTDKATKRDLLKFPTKKIRTEYPWITDTIGNLQDDIVTLLDLSERINIFYISMAVWEIGHRLHLNLLKIKNYTCQLEFSDVIRMAIDLLQSEEYGNWVRYRLDYRVRHILVDEAQDTNPEQWQLISQFISQDFFDNTGGRRAGTLFAVGDEKQSIFGFQGARPGDFRKFRDYFKQKAEENGQRFCCPSLINSYRSSSVILRVVDATFSDELEGCPSGASGKKTQHIAGKEHTGCVELWPILLLEGDDKSIDKEPWWRPITDNKYLGQNKSHNILADAIVKKIVDMIGKTYLHTKDRAVSAGDIMILTRRRGDFWRLLFSHLKQYNIPVVDADRVFLADHIIVKDCLSIIQWALCPADDLALAIILRSPICEISEEELFKLSYQRDSSLWQQLCSKDYEDNKYVHIHQMLNIMLVNAGSMKPFEFLFNLLNTHGIRKKFCAHMGAGMNDILDSLLEQCLQYEKISLPTLSGFISWFHGQNIEVVRKAGNSGDKVQIMTVHGAKGLEAPIVFVTESNLAPGGGRTPFFYCNNDITDSPPIWGRQHMFPNDIINKMRCMAEDEETWEHKRLLYVAMTRAEERLIICGAGRQSSKHSWWNMVHNGIVSIDSVKEIESPFAQENYSDDPSLMIGSEDIYIADKYYSNNTQHADPCVPDWLHDVTTKKDRGIVKPYLDSYLSKVGMDTEKQAQTFVSSKKNVKHRERGVLIHFILEKLLNIRAYKWQSTDIESKAWQLLGCKSCLNTSERQSIVYECNKVMMMSSLRDLLYNSHIMTEVGTSVSYDDCKEYNKYIIDALIIGNDIITIIDFKTGVPPVNGRIITEIRKQLANYVNSIERIYPSHVVQVGVVWTRIPELMMIPTQYL